MGDEEYPIKIHASTISPYNRKLMRPVLNNYSTLMSNKRLRPNQIIFLKTDQLQPTSHISHPVIGSSNLGKGLIAAIRSPLINPDGTLDLKVVDANKVRGWITSGNNPQNDLVIITPNKKVYPAHLPDLSDLALLPAAMKTVIRKIIQEQGCVEGICVQHLIPRCIKELVDPPSEFPNEIESCCLNPGKHSLVTNSYSNTLKMLTTDCGTQLTLIGMESTWLSKNVLDGRKICLDLNVAETSAGPSNAKATFVVWNCRDMARDSFLPSLLLLLEMQLPDVIVLAETRVSLHMARVICQKVSTHRICGRSRIGVQGGFVIISFNKTFRFERISESQNTTTWKVCA